MSVMSIDWTSLFATLIVSVGSAAVVGLINYGSNQEFKAETKRRLEEAESDIHRLKEDMPTVKGTAQLFLETMTEVKKQTNRIWEKLEKMDDELKEIYKNK